MVKAIKNFDLVRYGFQLAIVGLFSVCGLLYAQQNGIIAEQGEQMKEYCAKTEAALKGKVSNEVLMQLLKNQERERVDNKEQWVKQDRTNEKMLDSIEDLNENVILLNERMK